MMNVHGVTSGKGKTKYPTDVERSMSLKQERRVGEVMTTPLETVSRTATVSEAAARMREEGIRALVVTTSPPSILTSSDVLDAVAEGRDVADLTVAEIMTESVETVPTTIRTGEAAAMMESLGVNHLPVREGSDYVGMLSWADLADA
jgi:CBS domain-containing protein